MKMAEGEPQSGIPNWMNGVSNLRSAALNPKKKSGKPNRMPRELSRRSGAFGLIDGGIDANHKSGQAS
jgi:hypothetical protein